MSSLPSPKVTVVVLAYNQSAYIRQCLDGIFAQRLNCPFEVIVHDDASSDGTADVVREFEEARPGVLRAVYQRENQYAKHDVAREFVFPLVRGKYVAVCEGDDYWIDPLKLQRQVAFLDSNRDFSLVFHPVRVEWRDKARPDGIFPPDVRRFATHEPTMNELLKRNFIPTNSVMYRWCIVGDVLSEYPVGILPGDWFWHLLHAQRGRIGFLADTMAVYRRNSDGIWTGAWQDEKWFREYGLRSILFYDTVMSRFNYGSKRTLKTLVLATAGVLLDVGDEQERLKGKEILGKYGIGRSLMRWMPVVKAFYHVVGMLSHWMRRRLTRRVGVLNAIARHSTVLAEVL